MTTATKATDNSHDNGTCHHDAGDPCPAQQATGEQPHDDDIDDGSEKDRRNRERQQLQIDMENYILNQPRGLARLDAAGLAELRGIILRVIDDGDRAGNDYDRCGRADCYSLRWTHDKRQQRHEFVEPERGRPWQFEGESEAATEARMRFVEAIQQAIVQRAAPATTATCECGLRSAGKGGGK